MLTRQRPGRRSQSRVRAAFTLMEVLLVLVILVVLASMAVTIFQGTQEGAMQDTAKGQIGILKAAVDMYKFHCRNSPDGLDGLVNKPSDAKAAERWRGPYIDKVPLDPWDNEYKFAAPGKHNSSGFDIWSMGPDGQDGNADDIGNWEST